MSEFTYNYSAEDRKTAEKIREKYTTNEAGISKMEQLRRLDKGVTQKGQIIALFIGIISCLILGTGMCCFMLWNMLPLGVALGVVGIAGIAAAYPIYKSVIKKQRDKVAPQIIALSDEIIGK